MAQIDELCMACMEAVGEEPSCPHCGFGTEEPQLPGVLPYRTVLAERYLVGQAKRTNGEGVIYIGFDLQKQEKVEIRELYPRALAERAPDGAGAVPKEGQEEAFGECRREFLRYQQALMRFRNQPAITHIADVFEENDTAYAVASWQDAITLRYYVERSGGSLTWNAARQLFMPVLSSLSALHASGLSHLGISLDTLFILPDGSMMLGDFCMEQVRRKGTELPATLVSGCAALEQYLLDGQTLEEHTDVYGFAASLFFTLTGILPKDSLERKEDPRLLIPAATIQNIPPHVVTSLANALQVETDKRTPSFERMRAELSASPTVTTTIEETESLRQIPAPYPTQPAAPARPRREPPAPKKGVPPFVWVILSCAVALIVITVGIVIWMSMNSGQKTPASSKAVSSSSTLSTAGNGVISSADQIDVPNLVGKPYADYKEVSSGAEYQVVLSKTEANDTIPAGDIISQSPAAGERMVRGTAISVIVSDGTALTALPEVIGLSVDDAVKALSDSGFQTVQKEDGHSENVGDGQVFGYKGQAAGDKVASSSMVTILVNRANVSSVA